MYSISSRYSFSLWRGRPSPFTQFLRLQFHHFHKRFPILLTSECYFKSCLCYCAHSIDRSLNLFACVQRRNTHSYRYSRLGRPELFPPCHLPPRSLFVQVMGHVFASHCEHSVIPLKPLCDTLKQSRSFLAHMPLASSGEIRMCKTGLSGALGISRYRQSSRPDHS